MTLAIMHNCSIMVSNFFFIGQTCILIIKKIFIIEHKKKKKMMALNQLKLKCFALIEKSVKKNKKKMFVKDFQDFA